MTKTVQYIDCPEMFNGIDDYSSHAPMLYLALCNTKGHVVEFGMGKGSTPLFSFYCNTNNRVFNSFETNREWFIKCLIYDCVKTKIDDYKEQAIGKPGLLFIDSAPGEQRKELIQLHRDNADVIIIHDTEDGAQNIYGIREVLNSFKYRLNYYPEGNPGTTALSNKINVCDWV